MAMATKPLKARVAVAVANQLVRAVVVNIEEEPDVLEVNVSRLTPLQTQLRVKTQSEGTHYFLVQVSEQI